MSVFFRQTSIKNRPKTPEELAGENAVLTGKVQTLEAENSEIKAQMAALLGIEEGTA